MGVELEHFHGFVASVFALVRSFRMIRERKPGIDCHEFWAYDWIVNPPLVLKIENGEGNDL